MKYIKYQPDQQCKLICGECEKESPALVLLGDEDSQGTDSVCVCASCLQKALDLLNSAASR